MVYILPIIHRSDKPNARKKQSGRVFPGKISLWITFPNIFSSLLSHGRHPLKEPMS